MPQVDSVLLIDDDEISNFLTATVLKNSGAFDQIRISSDGQEALDLLQSEQEVISQYPDLIMLDLNMPNMNGFTFLKKFRELPGPTQKSRIIVLSTTNFQEDFDYLQQFPEVEVFLQKPLTEESLQYVLDRYFPVSR